MTYFARIYRILLSCPGDVTAARNVATEVIHEWNYAHSESQGIMLHPVAWDTHVSPGSGAKTQALINKSIVERCDLLVGIFWTRFGTPTDKYSSGTEEEIEVFWSSRRQTMLYFSDEPKVAWLQKEGERDRFGCHILRCSRFPKAI